MKCWDCYNFKRLSITNRSIKTLDKLMFDNYDTLVDHFKSKSKKKNGFDPEMHIWFCKENPNYIVRAIMSESTAKQRVVPNCKFKNI